jgi:hypothetical protein
MVDFFFFFGELGIDLWVPFTALEQRKTQWQGQDWVL